MEVIFKLFSSHINTPKWKSGLNAKSECHFAVKMLRKYNLTYLKWSEKVALLFSIIPVFRTTLTQEGKHYEFRGKT